MNSHHLTGITAIQAEAGAQNGIFLELQDEAGAITLVIIEVEQNLQPVRDLLVRAINSAARAGKPADVEAEVVILPRRNGLAFGDPKAPLTSAGGRTIPLVRGVEIGMGRAPAMVDDGPGDAA